MKICSYNEWDPLREVIVGVADSVASMVYDKPGPIPEEVLEKGYEIARRAYPQSFLDILNEDLEGIVSACEQFGAKVLRPNSVDTTKYFATPNWSATGNSLINMRDLHMVVGNTVVESASPSKHRFFESTGLYDIWYDYMKEGSNSIEAMPIIR